MTTGVVPRHDSERKRYIVFAIFYHLLLPELELTDKYMEKCIYKYMENNLQKHVMSVLAVRFS